MNNPFINLLLTKAMNDPRIANNPQKMDMLNVVMNGDEKRGREIANNLCKTYGETPENVELKARHFFNL